MLTRAAAAAAVMLCSARWYAAQAAADMGKRAETFFPMSVWYGGGKARAPMLESNPLEKADLWRKDLAQRCWDCTWARLMKQCAIPRPRNLCSLAGLGRRREAGERAREWDRVRCLERGRNILLFAFNHQPQASDARIDLHVPAATSAGPELPVRTSTRICRAKKKRMDAAAVLATAHQSARARADVMLLLAQVSAQLEFFVDAAGNYDKCLKLKPNDDVARRERGFMLACANEFRWGIPDLAWYVSKRPMVL